MKGPSIRAVEMTRKIRDRHSRRLAGKAPEEVIAFYRAAGQAARGVGSLAKPALPLP
jgi:hypothetical protein